MSKARTMSNLLTSSGDVITTALDNVGAAITAGSGIALGDNDKATFGAGDDFSISHNSINGNLIEMTANPLELHQAGTNSVLQLYNDDTAHNQVLQVFKENTLHGSIRTDVSKLIIDGVGSLELSDDGSTKLATTATGIDVTGVITTDGLTTSANINFGDNDKAMFGTGSDLRIYHDGGNSYIADTGTGSLFIQGTSLKLEDAGGNDYIAMTDTGTGGTVELKHNAVTKLATTATGIDVTGVITTDGMTTSADINFGDNDKAIFGASDDFQIYHDGTSGHTFLKESGSGSTILQTNTFVLQNAAGTQNIIMAPEGTSGIDFSYNGSVKLSTESNGIIVNGEVQATSLDISGSADIDGTLEADAITLNGTALGSLYSPIAGGSGIVTTGALNSGTITSGFGTINNGASTITTSGAVATGTLNTTGDITLSGELNLSSATNAYIDFADALHIRAIGSSPAYEDSIYCLKNAQTVLMYNGAGKINTTNTGVGVTGDVVASGNVTAYSDLRIKDNLEVIPDALSKVEQLNGYTYTRTDLEDKQEKHTGVIAQEVLKVLPEAVVLGETPEDNMAVAYGNMVGLLIEAVKELSDKVKELEGNQNGFTR